MDIPEVWAPADIPASITDPTDRVLYRRGIERTPDAVDVAMSQPLSLLPRSSDLADAAIAGKRLAQAVQRHEQILIHSDYDVDGAAGAAILSRTLRRLGHHAYRVFIPDRIADGYGLSESSLHEAERSKPAVFITVDCGIVDKGFAPKIAAATGGDVIITDHHLPQGGKDPQCLAVVNPNRVAGASPQHAMLCGATVAWCVAVELMKAHAGSDKLPDHLRDHALEMLQLAGLATVADVVPMRGANRCIVRNGLRGIASDPLPGIKALVDALELDQEALTSHDIGWRLGPCLNANGRLDSAMKSWELLDSDSSKRVKELAKISKDENQARRTLTDEVQAQAFAQVESLGVANGIVLAGDWHPGVVGIVAGRVAQKYHRPACVLSSPDPETGLRKGSLRTIDGVHLAKALEHPIVAAVKAGGGGHAKAAGVTVKDSNLEAFRSAFAAAVTEQFEHGQPPPRMRIYDAELTGKRSLDERLVGTCIGLAPYGDGHPEPMFLIKRVHVSDCRKTKSSKGCFGSCRDMAGDAIRFSDFSGGMRMDEARENNTAIDIVGTLSWHERYGLSVEIASIRPAV